MQAKEEKKKEKSQHRKKMKRGVTRYTPVQGKVKKEQKKKFKRHIQNRTGAAPAYLEVNSLQGVSYPSTPGPGLGGELLPVMYARYAIFFFLEVSCVFLLLSLERLRHHDNKGIKRRFNCR